MTKQYYELTDEKSTRFWEVEQKGSDVAVRWGKIGTDGAFRMKELDSQEDAIKEMGKLIKYRTKKGYVEVGVMSAHISYLKNLSDYCEWNENHVDKILTMNGFLDNYFEDNNIPLCKDGVVIDHEHLESDMDEPSEKWIKATKVMDELFKYNSLLNTTKLAFCYWDDVGYNSINKQKESCKDIVDYIVKNKSKLTKVKALQLGNYGSFALAQFEFSFSEIGIGDISKIWRALPNIESVAVEGTIGKLGIINNNSLQVLRIIGVHMTVSEILADIAKSNTPELQMLDLCIYNSLDDYDNNCSELVYKMLTNKNLSKLKHLNLSNNSFVDQIVEGLSKVDVFGDLEVIDLSYGKLTDIGGEHLLSIDGKSIKVISKKHFMSKDMVVKILTKHPHWKIETECKWRKEAIRDADEYGDDANSVDFWKSEYVEIFNDMMSQYHPYSY
jgi:predicted DNA-binding WGR domain protein